MRHRRGARGMAIFRRAFRSKMLYDMIFESTFTTIEENQYVKSTQSLR